MYTHTPVHGQWAPRGSFFWGVGVGLFFRRVLKHIFPFLFCTVLMIMQFIRHPSIAQLPSYQPVHSCGAFHTSYSGFPYEISHRPHHMIARAAQMEYPSNLRGVGRPPIWCVFFTSFWCVSLFRFLWLFDKLNSLCNAEAPLFTDGRSL